MSENFFISELAQKLIFEQEHNFKSFGALYNKNADQMSYIIKQLRQDEEFCKEFGKKRGSTLNHKQKYLLYLEMSEPLIQINP